MQDGTCSSSWESPAWSAWFTGPYHTLSFVGISSSSKEKANIEEAKGISF